MPRKAKTKQPIHSFLSIKIIDFVIHVDASINHEIFDSRNSFDSTHIFSFKSNIELTGKCTSPENRANCIYNINIYSYKADSKELKSTLIDYQAKNKDSSLKYRKVKDRLIPVYEPPQSIGFLEKQRGSINWRGCAFVSPQTITDMMILLPNVSPLYISIHEVKVARHHRVQGITLQTSDPEFE